MLSLYFRKINFHVNFFFQQNTGATISNKIFYVRIIEESLLYVYIRMKYAPWKPNRSIKNIVPYLTKIILINHTCFIYENILGACMQWVGGGGNNNKKMGRCHNHSLRLFIFNRVFHSRFFECVICCISFYLYGISNGSKWINVKKKKIELIY